MKFPRLADINIVAFTLATWLHQLPIDLLVVIISLLIC